MRRLTGCTNCNLLFVGTCTPYWSSTKQPVLYGVSQSFGSANGDSHDLHFTPRDPGLSGRKEIPSTALEKRRKDYFFKLLSAARSRDNRLLASVMRSLVKEDPRVQLDEDSTDSLRVQDVLLKAASRCGYVDLADNLFKKMLAQGRYPTPHTAGAFLDALKLEGQTDRCLRAFMEMMNNGLDLGHVCFNIVVSAIVQDGSLTDAVEMLERASQWGVKPDTYTFNIILSAVAKQSSAASKDASKKVLRLMMQWGVEPDIVTINARIHQAVKEGRLNEAVDVFERTINEGSRGVVPDVITFNVGISAYMAQHRDDRAFHLLGEMKRRGVNPRADTFNSLLTGLVKMGDTSRVIEVFNKFLRQGDDGGGFRVAPSLVTYNLVLQALCLKNDAAQARLVHFEMRQRKIKPDNVTLTAIVRLQRSRKDVCNIIQTARKLRVRPSLTFLNSCIRALGDHNDVYGACQIMDRIIDLENIEPDVISFNSLIFALVQDPWASKVIADGLGEGEEEGKCVFPEVTTSRPRRELDFLLRLPHSSDVVSNHGNKKTQGKGKGEEMGNKAPYCAERAQGQGGIMARLDGLTGAEAALLLLEEMKTSASADGSGIVPDIFTYTTVISGVVRAEDGRRLEDGGATWWHAPRNMTQSDKIDTAASSAGYISSAEMCQRLYVEALARGIQVNGKICNAALLGFGSDLTSAVKFWRQRIGPALEHKYKHDKNRSGDSPLLRNVEEERINDLLSAYRGLLHVCGRAQRPDAAVKVVFALRRNGIKPSSTLSNTYFKAKQETQDRVESSRSLRVPFNMMSLLQGQMEDALEAECGISKHSESVDLPIDRIRIRF